MILEIENNGAVDLTHELECGWSYSTCGSMSVFSKQGREHNKEENISIARCISGDSHSSDLFTKKNLPGPLLNT
jgi:hypothetical protein